MEMIYKDRKRGVEVYTDDVPPESENGVDLLIAAFNDRIPEPAQKMNIADYIRLLQLQKELFDDTPRDIEVTWIETPASEQISRKRLSPSEDVDETPGA